MDHWEEWQKVYQHGTIVILPPDEIRNVVNGQRETYDPVTASFCEAHITLTQPLLNPLSDTEWGNIQDMLRRFPAFEIQYGPIKSFLPYPCIWYEIQPADKILALRNALHQTGYFNLSLKHTDDFIPHMSITEGLSGPPVDEELLTILQEQSSQGSFICQDAVHIVPDESFCFGVVKRLPLDGGK